MLFYMLLTFCFAPFIFAIIGFIADKWEGMGFGMFIGVPISFIPIFIVSATWSCYANNLAIVDEQARFVSVLEQQRTDLNKTMSTFNYPTEGSMWNHDSPVASIVAQLGRVEEQLMSSRKMVATAYKDIAAVKRGPMSGVVAFVGE